MINLAAVGTARIASAASNIARGVGLAIAIAEQEIEEEQA